MNLLKTAIESEFACRLGWALVHSLWMGIVCAAVLMAGMVILRRRSANARYLCACAAMLLLLSASAAMYFLASVPKKPQAGMATPAGAASPCETPLLPAPRIHHVDPPSSAGPIPEHDKPASPATVLPPKEPVGAPSGVPASSPRPLFARAAESIEPALPWVVMAWMVGVVLAALWQMSSWLSAMRIRRLASLPDHSGLAETAARLARLLGLSRPAKVLQSMILKTPAVIGLLRPVILLPASLCTALPPAQLEAILLHELAHIRRMDYLVNLLQTLVETLLFYHPAVWYISSRIRIERENCCDDITIAHCGDATLYADALASTAAAASASTSLTPHHNRRPRKPATAISADGGKLLPRIRRILGLSDQQPARSALLSTAIALSVVLALIALPLTLSIAAPNATSPSATSGTATQPATHPAEQDRERSRERPLAFSARDIRDFYEKNLSLFTLPEQVRVKRIIAPTLQAAQEARARALKGENFDSLIAEYFIPYFATFALTGKAGAPNKHLVCSGWEDRKHLNAGGLDRLAVGEMSEPFQLPGGPEYYVGIITAERRLGVLPLSDVADKVYAHLCDKLRDRVKVAHPIDMGAWTTEGSPEAYSQYLELARQLAKAGASEDAAGAALLALQYKSQSKRMSDLEQFPEEETLLNAGIDLARYYRGMMNRENVDGNSDCGIAAQRLIAIDGAKAVPFLLRQLDYDASSEFVCHLLAKIGDSSAIPALRKSLSSDQLSVLHFSVADGQQSISAVYPVRIAAMEALEKLGVRTQGIKVSVGPRIPASGPVPSWVQKWQDSTQPATQSTTSAPATQPAATGAASQHTWTLPELSFLAWQEDQPAMAVNAVPRAWRPDGQLADSPDEQRTLRSVQGMRCSGPDPQSRFLQLWFFHPEADNRSTIKCTLRDDQGRTLQGQPADPFGWRVQEGWLLICLPAAPSQQPVPPAINIELQYAVGPWEEDGSLSPQDQRPNLLGLSSIVFGQDSLRRAYIEARREAGPLATLQYTFTAITDNEKEVASNGINSWTRDGVTTERYFFDLPLTAIKVVTARRRALQAVTFRNVSIEPCVRTKPSVQRDTPKSPATQPAAPGGLRSRDLSGTWAGERDGVKARIVFRGDDDASCRIEAPRATIGASLKLVDDQQSDTVGLRLDHFASATGKHGSTVIGKLERNASGPLSLTILPAAAELESDYQPVSQIPLQKISASSSTGPTTQASSDTILWGGVVEGRQYGISLDREGRECRLGDRLALKFHVRNAGLEAIEETVYPAGGQWSISHTNENGTQAIHILPMSSPSSRPATWAVPTSADHLLPPLGSDPRIVRIAPGQAVAVGQIELNLPKPAEAAALFAAVKPGQCIIRYQHHIPGTFAYQPPISGPLVINVLPATSSQPATQSATGKVAHATNLASERWGPATEGLNARLQCDKLVWATKEAVVVQVDLRNMGKADWTFPLTQQGLDIEVDGEEYEWDGPVENPGQTIGPAQALAGIVVVLDGHWVKKGTPATKLALDRGKHYIRVTFSAVPVNGADEVDVFSNRVSFWVLPADYADQVAKQSEQFTKAVINITQLGEANARVEVSGQAEMRELLAFFPDLGRKSGTAAGWEAGGTIELTKRDATTTKIVLSGNDNLNTWSAGQGDWSVCGDFLAYFTKLQQTATQPATQPATKH